MDCGDSRTRVRTNWRSLSAVGVLLLGGCLVDDDKLCNEGQIKEDSEFVGCICKPGTVPSADKLSCQPCGANEEAQGGACACKAGFRRPAAGMACAEIVDSGPTPDSGMATGPTGQDSPCTSNVDCSAFDATFCQNFASPSVCLVQGCATTPGKCASDRECCVVTVLPALAAANGLCVPAGKCMAPGMVVTP